MFIYAQFFSQQMNDCHMLNNCYRLVNILTSTRHLVIYKVLDQGFFSESFFLVLSVLNVDEIGLKGFIVGTAGFNSKKGFVN